MNIGLGVLNDYLGHSHKNHAHTCAHHRRKVDGHTFYIHNRRIRSGGHVGLAEYDSASITVL